MKIGIPKESAPGETRVAVTPDVAKKYVKLGLNVVLEKGAGERAGLSDADFAEAGARLAPESEVWGCDIVLKVTPPSDSEIARLKKGTLLVSQLEPYRNGVLIEKLAAAGVNAVAMELIPRTSRAQSMDVLSSQAGIAGYRAVLEAAIRFPRFFPMMMTSAGSSKPCKVAVLGVGVAGLQAIASAKRLGATVEAYDIRPEVKEQILSLGAKFIEVDVGESGSGSGGYAKELSEEGKRKQQQLLSDKLKKFDVIITTANVPGRKAPTLLTEEAVKGMRTGSVVIDMAAPSGGNCPLTEPGKIVVKHGVTVVGELNYPALVPGESSNFYSRNLFNLLGLFIAQPDKGAPKDATPMLRYNLEDDIVAAALVTHEGTVRSGKPAAQKKS
ncbi:MAG: Re/Si-specific NAD(P)(+) transhydrogenase subunit alpha [Bdellovibrionales bacterium]|nr:Re/Si-specific NAD(P)(+) transhydrogenase subunit alpha [Bdellovibrionales bacterium]